MQCYTNTVLFILIFCFWDFCLFLSQQSGDSWDLIFGVITKKYYNNRIKSSQIFESLFQMQWYRTYREFDLVCSLYSRTLASIVRSVSTFLCCFSLLSKPVSNIRRETHSKREVLWPPQLAPMLYSCTAAQFLASNYVLLVSGVAHLSELATVTAFDIVPVNRFSLIGCTNYDHQTIQPVCFKLCSQRLYFTPSQVSSYWLCSWIFEPSFLQNTFIDKSFALPSILQTHNYIKEFRPILILVLLVRFLVWFYINPDYIFTEITTVAF